MIKKILIANRGEIAVRAIRTFRMMGITSVAVYSPADKDSMHVKFADETLCIGGNAPNESYANKQAILCAALLSGADAIFPGFGFLSEDPSFVSMISEHDIKFIGPDHEIIQLMGDKITAKDTAKKLGIPCIPGSDGAVKTLEDAKKVIESIGYPCVIKASSGGGGRGIRVVKSADVLEEVFNESMAETIALYGNDMLYIEKYLTSPKHIEIQVIGDKHGNVLSLGLRDCSVQRRNQKIIEEASGNIVSKEEYEKISTITTNALKKLNYSSAGTIEFLYEDGEFYFMEMNTRLQVEHTVTECITQLDIIELMVKVENDEPLPIQQSDVKFNGHAIECRINAEDPFTFAPSPGKITFFHPALGSDVRIDTSVYSGYTISPFYDSMVAKLIVYSNTRENCIKRLEIALQEFIIQGNGLKHNIDLHKYILKQEKFIDGTYNIKWLEEQDFTDINN